MGQTVYFIGTYVQKKESKNGIQLRIYLYIAEINTFFY